MVQSKLFLKRFVVQVKALFLFEDYLLKLVKHFWIDGLEIVLKTTKVCVEPLLYFLNSHLLLQVNTLNDLVVYDRPSGFFRFNVIYHLFSHRYNIRFQVHTSTNEVLPLMSVTHLFLSAGWLEREVWDLFGIFFINNKDLRRILTDYGFKSHPLRKDFPLVGYREIFYSDRYKRVVHSDVKLFQSYRIFKFRNPW